MSSNATVVFVRWMGGVVEGSVNVDTMVLNSPRTRCTRCSASFTRSGMMTWWDRNLWQGADSWNRRLKWQSLFERLHQSRSYRFTEPLFILPDAPGIPWFWTSSSCSTVNSTCPSSEDARTLLLTCQYGLVEISELQKIQAAFRSKGLND